MRELRVVGVDADGNRVICQDPGSGEKFQIAADERLRAAARGDISRLGQIEIEMESVLRPREIQSRIRAGATVAEVAAIAGVGVDKIERFAHPVLLERTRATELAALSHPIREDGPAVATLGEIVSEALGIRGHSANDTEWDAWKGEDGYWVVQVGWKVGRSDNYAHWRFHPGAHGGTSDPLDDNADQLTHPETLTPRRLTPVAVPPLATTTHTGGHDEVTVNADELIGAQRARHMPAFLDVDESGTAPFDFDEIGPEIAPSTPAASAPPATVPSPAVPSAQSPAPAAGRTDREAEVTEEIAATEIAATAADAKTGTDAAAAQPRRRKSRKPAVPAWEDVLLGVRSNGNS